MPNLNPQTVLPGYCIDDIHRTVQCVTARTALAVHATLHQCGLAPIQLKQIIDVTETWGRSGITFQQSKLSAGTRTQVDGGTYRREVFLSRAAFTQTPGTRLSTSLGWVAATS